MSLQVLAGEHFDFGARDCQVGERAFVAQLKLESLPLRVEQIEKVGLA